MISAVHRTVTVLCIAIVGGLPSPAPAAITDPLVRVGLETSGEVPPGSSNFVEYDTLNTHGFTAHPIGSTSGLSANTPLADDLTVASDVTTIASQRTISLILRSANNDAVFFDGVLDELLNQGNTPSEYLLDVRVGLPFLEDTERQGGVSAQYSFVDVFGDPMGAAINATFPGGFPLSLSFGTPSPLLDDDYGLGWIGGFDIELTYSVAAASVPEPAAALVLSSVLPLLLCRRRRSA